MTAMATTIYNDNDGPPQTLATTIMTAMATTILMSKRERGRGYESLLIPTHVDASGVIFSFFTLMISYPIRLYQPAAWQKRMLPTVLCSTDETSGL